MKYGDNEWYLYHHINNEKPIIPLVLLSLFLIFCYGGIFWIILIWYIYFAWANNNNEKLNNDPNVLKRRQYVNEAKKQLGIK